MADKGLLDGYRVLDLSDNVAGPYAAMVLAELGAEVIKIESPGGDDTRAFPPFQNGESVIFGALNPSKRSVAVNLKHQDGKRIVWDLVKRSDVVIQNFRPGNAERLGVDEETLRKINPKLIYASITAFGKTGPARDRPGYDPLIQAFSGLMSLTGEEGGGPVRVAASIVDMTVGMWVAVGVLARLSKRDGAPAGRSLEVALCDVGMGLLCHQAATTLATGQPPAKLGSASPLTAPYQAFSASDGYIMIAAGNDRLFARLCSVLGLEDLLKDERFSTGRARVANRPALQRIIEEMLSRNTVAAWFEALSAAGVPCGPVNTLSQSLADPIVQGRGLVVEVPGSSGGEPLRLVRLPLQIDGNPLGIRHAPRRLGEDTDGVLAELGWTPNEIEKACGDGVVKRP